MSAHSIRRVTAPRPAALVPAALALAAASCGGMHGSTQTPGGQGPKVAHAVIEGRSGSHASGNASFISTNDGVRITVHITGASPGMHAVHLHDKGDCSAPDATSAGPHFNPTQHTHGSPQADPHHAGDFGNMQVGPDSSGTLELVSRDLTVDPGPKCVVGHSIVVHGGTDDFTSQPAGNSGPRVGCGVVVAGP